METFKVFTDPCNEVILECAFDDLVKEVTRDELVDICMRELMCEWLEVVVSGARTLEQGRITYDDIRVYTTFVP